MNIGAIVRDSWRITWRNWQLWLINLLLFIAFTPSVLLTGSFGVLAGLLTAPSSGPQSVWERQLREILDLAWVGIAAMVWIVLVTTTCVSWVLQAASMRGAALAADKGAFTLLEALNLGRQRLFSLLKLSLTFGALIAALSLAPLLLLLLVGQQSPAGLLILNGIQTLLTPVNFVLGIALLLVMMSIALEDLKPGAAFKRSWKIFSTGWWAFLFVFGTTLIMSFVVTLIAVILLMPLAVGLIAAFLVSPVAGVIIIILDGLITLVIIGPLALFIAVFTIVLYTLTYREAARLKTAD